MNVRDRIFYCRLIEKMNGQAAYAEKLGLDNESVLAVNVLTSDLFSDESKEADHALCSDRRGILQGTAHDRNKRICVKE